MEMTPFGRGNRFHKFLRNACFYLTTKILLLGEMGWAHFWIFGLPFGVWGIGVSSGPDINKLYFIFVPSKLRSVLCLQCLQLFL